MRASSKLTVVYEDINLLKPYKHNAKIHTEEQVGQIKKSIREFGFNDPIAVDEENVIIEGHGRLMAAKELGMKEVPVIFLYGLTDQQKKAYILAHNQLTMNTGFDMDVLADEINRITAFDMEDFGFDLSALGEEEKNPEDVKEDEPPEPPAKPKSRLGEIYKLGEHRLMCGDSTKAEDVEKLMDGMKADLVVTDPPYNVAVGDSNKKYEKEAIKHGWKLHTENLKNDKMSEEEFSEFISGFVSQMKEQLKPGAAYYIWHSVFMQAMLEDILKQNDMRPRQQLIWNKNEATLGRQDYQWKHEPCFYGWKEGASHYFIDTRTNKTVFEDAAPDFQKMKKEDLIKLLKDIYSPDSKETVLYASKMMTNTLHPTMKPIKLLAQLINNSSRSGELVLDLFGGSGSTMMACEQMGRKCFMMEYDPKYVDVIIERWEKLTGKKAQKIEG